jgi:acetyl-CoA synthetase
VVGPLLLGQATALHEGAFTVESLVRIVADRTITNLAAAPTDF